MKLYIIKDLICAGHTIESLSNYLNVDADEVYSKTCDNIEEFKDLKFI